MKPLFSFSFLILLSACSTTTYLHPVTVSPDYSNWVAGKPNQDGDCIVSDFIGRQVDTTWTQFPVYTGKDPNAPLKTDRFKTGAMLTKWVKKKADGNCLSANPDDCLVWCLVETGPAESEVTYLTDTIRYKEFSLTRVPVHIDIISQGVLTKIPVVCQDKLTVELAQSISKALVFKGYLPGEQDQFNALLFAGLKKYQMDNGLVAGKLTIETLESLHIH
jgi:hypothetical protein